MDIAPTNVQCATAHYDVYIEKVFDAKQSVGAVAEFSYDLLVNSIDQHTYGLCRNSSAVFFILL